VMVATVVVLVMFFSMAGFFLVVVEVNMGQHIVHQHQAIKGQQGQT